MFFLNVITLEFHSNYQLSRKAKFLFLTIVSFLNICLEHQSKVNSKSGLQELRFQSSNIRSEFEMLVAGSFWSLAHVGNQYLNTRFKLYHLSFFLLISNIVLWYLAFHNPRVSSLQHVTEPGLTRALTKGEFTRSPWSHARHFCRGPYIFLHTRNTDE